MRHGTRQQVSGAGSRPCQCECLRRCVYRRAVGGDVFKLEHVERRQRAAVERGGEGGATGVGDLGVAEVELLELLQPSSRRRRLEG